MTAYLAAYVAIALSIRVLAGYFTVIEIAILRSAGSIVIAALIVKGADMTEVLGKTRLRDDFARSVLHMAGSLALIWSVANLPLALVSTIEFSGPLFAAALVFVATRRRPDTVPAVGLGIIGLGIALLLARLEAVGNSGILIALGAVAALATTNIMLARLAVSRKTSTIILVMHVIQLPLYLLIATVVPQGWLGAVRPDIGDLAPAALIVIVAAALALVVGGFLTQAALANASRHGTPLQLCATDVLRIPLITLAAFLVLGEAPLRDILLPGLWVICGAIITSLPHDLLRARAAA